MTRSWVSINVWISQKEKSHCEIFPDMWSNPSAKVHIFSFLFVRLYLMIFFSLIIKDSHCRQCCFLCLRMFLKVASLTILGRLSRKCLVSCSGRWARCVRRRTGVRLQHRMQTFVPRKSEVKQVLGGTFSYSVSCVNSIFGRPNAWINQMFNQ